MAATFVPIPFPVTCYGAKSLPKRGSQLYAKSSSTKCAASSSEDHPMVQRNGPWCSSVFSPAEDENWSGCRGKDRLDWSSTLLQVEEKYGESWVSPTLLGYEILEERAKYTVFKILVTGIQGDSWMVFRRYTDFCSLSDKLKELFPGFRVAPPLASKRRFRDNYDKDFLEERRIGLQVFLQDLTSRKDVIRSEVVRRFLCLVGPPSPFDSLEESRAFFKTLEETNHRLQRELLERQREADVLKKTLKQKEKTIDLLLRKTQFSSEGSEDFCKRAAGIAKDEDGEEQAEMDEHERKHRRK